VHNHGEKQHTGRTIKQMSDIRLGAKRLKAKVLNKPWMGQLRNYEQQLQDLLGISVPALSKSLPPAPPPSSRMGGGTVALRSQPLHGNGLSVYAGIYHVLGEVEPYGTCSNSYFSNKTLLVISIN